MARSLHGWKILSITAAILTCCFLTYKYVAAHRTLQAYRQECTRLQLHQTTTCSPDLLTQAQKKLEDITRIKNNVLYHTRLTQQNPAQYLRILAKTTPPETCITKLIITKKGGEVRGKTRQQKTISLFLQQLATYYTKVILAEIHQAESHAETAFTLTISQSQEKNTCTDL